MKIDASVELVTLSDSLTSPRPKPKPKSKNAEKGTTKVVCLDSDTESDGSYAHTFVNGFAVKIGKFGDSGCSPNACKQQDDSWLGLRKCANNRKSWSPSHSLSFVKEADIDAQASFNAIDQSENYHGVLELVIKSKQDADITPLIKSDNLHSLQIVPLPDLDCRPNADHKAMQLSKGTTDITMRSSFSPCTSLDQGIYVDKFYSYNSSMSSPSPCHEVKSALMPPTNTQDMDAPENHGTCFSSPSQEVDDYTSPAWDDHLKGIISKLETSKAFVPVPVIKSQKTFGQGNKIEDSDHEDDDKDSGGYSFLKKNTGKRDAGDISDSGDSSSCKRRRKNSKGGLGGADSKPTGRTMGGSKSKTARIAGVCRTTVRNIDDDATQNDTEKLKKKEKQMKDREEREAKKQQLKEERAILRQEKQEEKRRQQELKKRRNEEEKKRKEELKVEAGERRKVEKEKEKWEKGKFALQNITALVDTQILEQGLIGGHLLTRFAEKGFKYHLVTNPVKKTVIWQMKLPSKELVQELQEDCESQDSQELKTSKKSGPQLSLESRSVSYVLIVLEAEEFMEMITEGALDRHVRNLQKLYPGFTLCYLINKLMRHLHKREQQQYKNPGDNWTRPPVEQVLAKLVTSYGGVHSRLCVDEAEVSEHIVGLTRSLAECPFKRKLTPLSLSANGDHVVKNDPNNEVIKKDVWLKALVALPKVSGSCAIAIAKKYPSMSALFEAYLDPLKTVHEKEHLLQDLVKEGLLGGESNRRVGPACSRRVYRILMAEQGNLHTDDVEEGADAFRD